MRPEFSLIKQLFFKHYCRWNALSQLEIFYDDRWMKNNPNVFVTTIEELSLNNIEIKKLAQFAQIQQNNFTTQSLKNINCGNPSQNAKYFQKDYSHLGNDRHKNVKRRLGLVAKKICPNHFFKRSNISQFYSK